MPGLGRVIRVRVFVFKVFQGPDQALHIRKGWIPDRHLIAVKIQLPQHCQRPFRSALGEEPYHIIAKPIVALVLLKEKHGNQVSEDVVVTVELLVKEMGDACPTPSRKIRHDNGTSIELLVLIPPALTNLLLTQQVVMGQAVNGLLKAREHSLSEDRRNDTFDMAC